jgi:glycosyltransferase involved in cell wall biosynthesis
MGGDTRNQGHLDSGLRAWAEHHLRVWDIASSSRPDVIIANSENTVARIAKIYRRDSTVIYPPVDTERFVPTEDALGDYFLTVGQLVAYKRVDLAIAACIANKKHLTIVGEGPERSSLEKLANNSPYIEFLGRVSLAYLQDLYAHTQGFIFAGEEDLGIVPIEAMSAGRPVLAFGKGGLTETVKQGVTGAFFLEQTPESISNALSLFEPKAYSAKEIRTHAQTFSTGIFNSKIIAAVSPK